MLFRDKDEHIDYVRQTFDETLFFLWHITTDYLTSGRWTWMEAFMITFHSRAWSRSWRTYCDFVTRQLKYYRPWQTKRGHIVAHVSWVSKRASLLDLLRRRSWARQMFCFMLHKPANICYAHKNVFEKKSETSFVSRTQILQGNICHHNNVSLFARAFIFWLLTVPVWKVRTGVCETKCFRLLSQNGENWGRKTGPNQAQA